MVAHLQAAFTDNWLKTRANVLNHDDYFPAIEPVGDMRAQVFKSSPREGGDSARLMFLLSLAAAREKRDELKAQGVEVTDMPGGAKWKRV